MKLYVKKATRSVRLFTLSFKSAVDLTQIKKIIRLRIQGSTERLRGDTQELLNVFSGEYYGIRLLKPGISTAVYASIAIVIFVLLLNTPFNVFGHFSYINLTEQNITIVTLMLTVLLSAGFVFLGDDTKGWSLARITIIRDVVRLRGLITAVVLICVLSVLPDLSLHSYTLKELSAPILFMAYLFILSIFLRVYRWLSDLAADPRLFDDTADNESRTFPSKSYRFARIVYLIRHNNRRDVWQSILERRIPEGYEEFIHQEFFRACDEMIRSEKTNKLQELSFLLEIYEKYYKLRNLDSLRFEYEYLGKFLGVYNQVYGILRIHKPKDVKLAVLWRGQSALERIIAEQTKMLMSGPKVYSLFKAIDDYVVIAKLVHPENPNKFQTTKVLDNFINTLLNTLYTDKDLKVYDIESWVDDKHNWQITYNSVFEEQNNVTVQFWKHFEDWLYAKLDLNDQRSRGSSEYLLVLDGIIGLFFPGVDPINFSRLYWFKYSAKNTTDSKFIAQSIYESHRPFGHIGRVDVELVTGDKDESLQHFAARQSKLSQASIKLFAHLSANYFRSGFWNINEIIKEFNLIIKDVGEESTGDIQALVRDLSAVKKELNL